MKLRMMRSIALAAVATMYGCGDDDGMEAVRDDSGARLDGAVVADASQRDAEADGALDDAGTVDLDDAEVDAALDAGETDAELDADLLPDAEVVADATVDANVVDAEVDANVPSALEITGLFFDRGTNTTLRFGAQAFDLPVIEYDNTSNVLYTQLPTDDNEQPRGFNKLIWTEPGATGFYVCEVAHGLATLAAAKASSATADATDTETGCAGAAWVHATEALEITGHWLGEEGPEAISTSAWAYEVVSFDNTANTLVRRRSFFLPGTAKLVWTEPSTVDGSFHFCVVDANSEDNIAEFTPQANLQTGCNGQPWTRRGPVIELLGDWYGENIALLSVGATGFYLDPYDFYFSMYDNQRNIAVVANPDDGNPLTYTKLVWTEPADGGFWLCGAVQDATSVEAAENSTAQADASNPAAGGCGAQNLPWIQLRSAIEFGAQYQDDDGYFYINSHTWRDDTFVWFDNATNVAITRTPANTYNRIEWRQAVKNQYSIWGLEYCVTARGLASQAAAENDPVRANRADPAMGCNGGPFSLLQ